MILRDVTFDGCLIIEHGSVSTEVRTPSTIFNVCGNNILDNIIIFASYSSIMN